MTFQSRKTFPAIEPAGVGMNQSKSTIIPTTKINIIGIRLLVVADIIITS